MLEFSINGQIITRNDEDPIVRDSQNYVTAYFLGDEEWRSHGTVTAIFKGADGQTFNMILNYDPHYGHSCLVPWEVLTQPWFEVSAFCGNLITANTVKVFTIKSGYDSTRDSRIPTPDVYNQIIEQLNRIEDEVDPEAVKAFVDEYLEGKDFVTESDVETILESYISVTPILQSGTKIAEIEVNGETKEIYAPAGGGASSLSDLTDTSISSPQSGDVLVYDGEKWRNGKQNIENTTENTELQIVDDNENVGVEIGSDDWAHASFMEKYGFGGFPYGYENLPPKNKFSGLLESDMFVVDGGKGRWNGIDTGNAKFGGHLFEGWNAPHDARLTFGIGIKNKDVSFIATFRPHSTEAQNDGYYGIVKIGDDREKAGTVFTNGLEKHNGLMCLATSIPNDTATATQRLAASEELAQTDYDSTANIPYGAMYFDLTEQKVKVYTSSGWKALAWEV